MNNPCRFSPCRTYRYTLEHGWDNLLASRPGLIAWIGLNPSSADETRLDHTVTKAKAISDRRGYRRLVMLNLFAFRSTAPKGMKAAADPVGPDNDRWILDACDGAEEVVAAWGAHGTHLGRVAQVLALLGNRPLLCLKTTANGQPWHPLYVKNNAALVPFP